MKILWFPWSDPLAPLVDRDPPEEDEDDPEYHEALRKWGRRHRRKRKGGEEGFEGDVLVGPHGAIPLHESNLPSTLFNFWLMHTDFSITWRVLNILERIDGVETLDVFTRYRARIGIGKAFDDKAVRAAIEKALLPRLPLRGAQALLSLSPPS